MVNVKKLLGLCGPNKSNVDEHTGPVISPEPLDPLSVIGERERLRCIAVEKWDSLETGQDFRPDTVFGEDFSREEENAFWDVVDTVCAFVAPKSIPGEEELDTPRYQGADGRTRLLNRMADFYLFVKQEEETSIKLYREAADRGSGYAYTRIGGNYRYAHNDMETAIEYYKKAIIADGDSNALLDLGLCYLDGNGVPRDYQKARELMLRSANQGNPAARHNMGWFYSMGAIVGVPLDWDTAMKWFRLGARDYYEQSFWAICKQLGETEETLYWAKRFADRGFPYGCYYLGGLYLDGVLVEKDPENGLKMLEYAATYGVPAAAKKCSECYSRGIGTAVDHERSEYYSSLETEILKSDSEYVRWDRPEPVLIV